MINIVRQNRGRAKTRFNILLKGLLPRYQKVLLKNPIISRYSTDDRFIKCLFKIEDARIKVSHLTRPFINSETREVSDYSTVKKSFKELDWECAYCEVEIKSKVDNFKTQNFVCPKCHKHYVKDGKLVNQLVLDSMVKFVNHYKSMMRENQKMFLKYINKNKRK